MGPFFSHRDGIVPFTCEALSQQALSDLLHDTEGQVKYELRTSCADALVSLRKHGKRGHEGVSASSGYSFPDALAQASMVRIEIMQKELP